MLVDVGGDTAALRGGMKMKLRIGWAAAAAGGMNHGAADCKVQK